MVSRLDVLRSELGLFIETNQKKVSLAIMANLTDSPPLGTPVATTFASTNWIPSVGKPFEGLAGSKTAINSSLQSSGLSKVLGVGKHVRGVGGRFVARDIHITNNTPYINRLNAGSSTQSPSGFVQIAIARAKSDAKKR